MFMCILIIPLVTNAIHIVDSHLEQIVVIVMKNNRAQ